MRGLRPGSVTPSSLVMAGLAAAFFGIARSTGSGWVTVLLCMVLGCLALGLAWPALSLGRVRVKVSAPRDATVDGPLAVGVEIQTGAGLKLRLVEPPGEWLSAGRRARDEVVACPARRGVFDAVVVELASAAPLGLFWWYRLARVPLAAPLEVGPRRLAASPEDLALAGAAGPADAVRTHTGHGAVRSVRPYLPGDAARLVHWPATARWGEVMVKELDDPELPRLAIVADLRHGGQRAEVAASRTAGLAEAALDLGVPVWLATAERDRGVTGEVTSPRQVGQRLARAVAAVPPDGPAPLGSILVRVDG